MMDNKEKILVTGVAGFIGFHLARRILEEGGHVIGIDNMNLYYDAGLKKDRLKILSEYKKFLFNKVDISSINELKNIFENNSIDIVVNLAAQAGVRYSLENPSVYVDSNLSGFVNLLECCRYNKVKHLVFASSSSVYGANIKRPFSVHHNVDHPVSLYAATKKANELMAHAYSHLFGLPCTGLRFFTVYGPWGRPDMAPFLFTKAILEEKPIKVFNQGKMQRDFTYIDDIIEGVIRVIDKIPEPDPDWSGNNPDPGTSYTAYKIYNIGNNNPVELMEFIKIIEKTTKKQAKKEFCELQPGDVRATFANIDDLVNDIGFKPSTSLKTGIKHFVEWYKDYYRVP